MSWFNFLSKKRPAAQGFAPKKKGQELPQAFILEPILTPSGVLDGTDNPIDPVDIDISADPIADIDIPEIEEGFDTISDNDLEEIPFVTSVEGEETLEEIPFVTSLDDAAESEATDEALTDETPLNESLLTGLDSSSVTFESGVFTVGQTGEVSVDFLFDGGGYEGELAVFSLEGMEEFEPGSEGFIQEAASRALSDSELGHVVISDQTEGARFVGELGESDRNSGEYLGVQTVQMRPGDEFGFMLVPNNTVQRVFDNPDVGGAARPLFSMATANPDDGFHVGQIADVTGDGSTFVMEDLRVDTKSDGDYNDVIFRVNGATGEAALLDNLIDPADDWRSTELGQKIAANVQSPAAPGKELPGDPIHSALPEPTVPQTTVDQGGDGFSDVTDSSEQTPESNPGEVVENTQTSTEASSPETVSVTADNTVEPNRGGALPNTPTPIESSSTQDVIDQVSQIDPTDIYRVSSQQLVDTEISVLSGNTSVSIQTPEGEVLSQQVLTRGTHGLTVPEDISGDVLIKLESQAGSDGTYILKGFESKAEEPFNIDLEFEGLTASQRETIQAAAKSVESLIGQGLPSAIVDGKIIDDVNFKISVNNLDGVGRTLARTKIDFMRYGTLLPAQSLTQFDVNDIAELEQSGQLFSVVQHEILHGLGFGNLWEAKGLVDYAGTPLAQYNGENAVAAFQDVVGLTDAIPLETEGEGSAGLHWHEQLFQDELMTADLGFQTGEEGETISPISPITLAALADLGYRVNLDKSTPGWGLLGGQQFNPDNLTKEQIKAFRQLTEETFAQPDDEFIYAIMSEVDPAKVSPEIWAHAERFWKNGEYYDWQRYQIKWGDTLSQIALDTMGSAHPDYYWFIANRNGIPNPNYIVTGDWIDIPVHRPNYEWEQEQERKRRAEELRKKQEEEARKRREEEERLAREKTEQERKQREEEERRKEAEAKQRELEEQERRLREEQERKRQQEEYEREQARLRELERQREIARQKGKGGQDWFFATRLPEFGPTDPFETSLTGETVGNLVPDDYYRFNLSRKGRVTAELKQLLADADLVLYDVRNNPIAWSMRDGITDEQIIADLIPGTYMLRVNSPKGVTTDYDLIVKFQHLLSMTQKGPPPGWRVGGGGGGSVGSVTNPLLTRQNASYFNARPQFYTTGNIFAQGGVYGSSLVGGRGTTEGNCTWYAHGRVKELGGNVAALNSMGGNANQWHTQLSNGTQIVSSPRPGDIAQWTRWYTDSRGVRRQMNHVAVVEKVNGDGTIIISESHWKSEYNGSTYVGYGKGTLHNVRTIQANNPDRYIRVPGVKVESGNLVGGGGGESGEGGGDKPELILIRTGGATYIDQLKREINTLKKDIKDIDRDINNKQKKISKKEKEIKDKEFWMWSWLPWVKDEINGLKDEVRQLKSEISDLKSSKRTKGKELNSNQSQLKEEIKVAAFLDTIAFAEGTDNEKGYRTIYSYKYFDSYEDHPRRKVTANGITSDAAGRYQILSTTWDGVKDSIGAKDFSPQNQDLAAIELIKRRNALEDVKDGKIKSAIEKCSWEWASFPPGRYGQPVKNMDEMLDNYQNNRTKYA